MKLNLTKNQKESSFWAKHWYVGHSNNYKYPDGMKPITITKLKVFINEKLDKLANLID